jgi:hypothetical protein
MADQNVGNFTAIDNEIEISLEKRGLSAHHPNSFAHLN